MVNGVFNGCFGWVHVPVCGRVFTQILCIREWLRRAQSRAAETLVRFRSLRMTCRLVLFLSTRAVKSRCSARGRSFLTFMMVLVPVMSERMSRCERCSLWPPRNIVEDEMCGSMSRGCYRLRHLDSMSVVAFMTGMTCLPLFPFMMCSIRLLSTIR